MRPSSVPSAIHTSDLCVPPYGSLPSAFYLPVPSLGAQSWKISFLSPAVPPVLEIELRALALTLLNPFTALMCPQLRVPLPHPLLQSPPHRSRASTQNKVVIIQQPCSGYDVWVSATLVYAALAGLSLSCWLSGEPIFSFSFRLSFQGPGCCAPTMHNAKSLEVFKFMDVEYPCSSVRE